MRRSGELRKEAAILGGAHGFSPAEYPPKEKRRKKIERPEGAMVYYSMDNLRGRLGSTRKTKRGLGCNADSSTNSEGIIEGKMSVNSLSDLSPLPFFLEAGKTRLQSRKLQRLGG